MTRIEWVAFDRIRTVAEAHGCEAAFGRGGKHAHVIVTAPDGQWAKLAVASSPRAGAAEVDNWSRQHAHQALRRLGIAAERARP